MKKRIMQVTAALAGWLILGAPFAFVYFWLARSDAGAGMAVAAGMLGAGVLMLVELAKD